MMEEEEAEEQNGVHEIQKMVNRWEVVVLKEEEGLCGT